MPITTGMLSGSSKPVQARQEQGASWRAVRRLWQRLWCRQEHRSREELVEKLELLRQQEGGDVRPARHMSTLFVGLLGGMQALAMKGQVRMVDDPQVLQRLCEHVRELGLMAGTHHLPLSRWQRWMEDRVLLQGLMTGVLGDLSITLPPGEVDYLRRPLLHMALFEHLCTLAWSNSEVWSGRITLRALQGKLIYHVVMTMDNDAALSHVARGVWELEKILLVAGENRMPNMEVEHGGSQLTLIADP